MSNRTDIHDKIQQITAKLIELNSNFAQASQLSQIDIDVLRRYTADLYDEILTLQPQKAIAPTSTPIVEAPAPEMDRVISVSPPVEVEAAPLFAPEMERVVSSPPVEFEATSLFAPETDKVESVSPPEAEFTPYYKPQSSPPTVMANEPVAEATPTPTPKVELPPVAEEKPTEPVIPAPQPPVVTPIVPTPIPVAEVKPEPTPIPPTYKEVVTPPPARKTPEVKETSLNYALQQPEVENLASKLGQTAIHDLKKAISINKKFEFINQLFGGDHENYTKSVHYLNGLSNSTDAQAFFNSLKKEYAWDEESKRYIEFADLVRRRFL